jgi:hypothetical protein
MTISLEEFLKIPNQEEWQREQDDHLWLGPDGSSSSLDDVQGIRIGISSPSFKRNHDEAGVIYPASLHDWRYQLGRRLRLPERYRKAADEGYRAGCRRKTSHLIGFSGTIARWQCAFRYWMLRHFAMGAWRD